MLVYTLYEGVGCTAGFPIRGQFVRRTFFGKMDKNCMEITISTFLRWDMGDMGEQVNFSGGGGSLSTRGNPAQKLLCFFNKTMNIHGTRATTLASQLLYVMTAMFVYVSSAGISPEIICEKQFG